MPGVTVRLLGADELVHELERAAKVAATVLPQKAASILAEHSRRAFREPALRPATWPPLAQSTLRQAGRTGKGVKEAKAKAAEFAKKAVDIAAASGGLAGKKLEANMRKSLRAQEKAAKWKKEAANRAAAVPERPKACMVRTAPTASAA